MLLFLSTAQVILSTTLTSCLFAVHAAVPVWFVDTKIRCGLIEQHKDPRSTSIYSKQKLPSFSQQLASVTLLHHPLTTSFVFQNSHSCMGIAPQAVNSGLSWIDHLLLAGTAWHSTSIWPLGRQALTWKGSPMQVSWVMLSHCFPLFSYLWLLKQTLPSPLKPFAFTIVFALWDCRCSAVLKTSRSTSRRSGTVCLILFDFFLEIRPDLVTWAQRKAVSDCRHTAMSWLLCRTCALQTHAPKWLLRLSSHEADLQWCCLHHFDELRPQRYPGSMFRLQTSKFGSGNMRTQHSSACNEHEEKEHWNAMCYCCTLYTVSPTSIESIPYTSIYLPCTFLLLRWLSCSQTSGAVPADLAQSTARSLASDLLEGLSAQQRSYSEPSGPIFLLQRKRLTCSTFTMSSPTARRWRFHLDNPWYSRHNIKTSSNNINHPKFSW